MSRFNRVVLAAILGLGLAVVVLSVASARLGPTVDSVTTANSLDGTLVNSQIAVTFAQPMQVRSVERAFRLTPRTAGDFSWSGNQMLFIPRKSLKYATTYRLTVDTRALDSSGHHLGKAYSTHFATQSQHLMYLGTEGSEKNRLVLASVGGSRQVVGSNDGLVTDYSLSYDRSLAVYTKRGSSRERPDEIWLLNMTDNSTQRLFRRPDWDLSQPHLSPDKRYVVFLATNVLLCRKYYGCYRNRTAPVIYLLDLRTLKVTPFKSGSDVPLTNFIDFSPTNQIAYTDLGSALTLANANGTGILHIPNSGNSLEFASFSPDGSRAAFVGQTPQSTGGDVLVYDRGTYTDVSKGIYDSSTPSFSSTGNQIAFAGYRGEQGIEPIYGINVYDFIKHRIRNLTSERHHSDWAPQWSADSSLIAFVRSQPQEAMYLGGGKIWVVRADGTRQWALGGAGQDISWVS